MIIEKQGDILLSSAEAIVNPINTRGVMGAGLALQVKRAYPAIFAAYKTACERREVVMGRMWVVPLPSASATTSDSYTRYMVNFPTKDHWRAPSRIEYIESGLVDLARWIQESGVRSIAIPKLGCANGKLEWADVRPVIVKALEGLDVLVELYV